jgi:hypothetical protein
MRATNPENTSIDGEGAGRGVWVVPAGGFIQYSILTAS